jgi:two-component system LytT family response regulator
MIKVIIIDDEPLATELIETYLKDFPDFMLVGICQNGFEGIKAIQLQSPDLVFLDVEMPKINGFEMLELLENPPAVIFTTAYDQYAVNAFDSSAVDYLLKPFSKSRFAQAIEKFKAFSQVMKPEEENKEDLHTGRIVLKDRGEIKIIPVNEIVYLEANDDYVNIYTREAKFLKNKTLGSFENSLDKSQFVRVHRSYLVNVSEINRLELYEKDSYRLLLRSGAIIPVSKSGYPKLKSVLGI